MEHSAITETASATNYNIAIEIKNPHLYTCFPDPQQRMSEEILKALMQLFALIVKQDEGMQLNEREYVAGFLRKQLARETVNEYLALFDSHVHAESEKHRSLYPGIPSVRDSVKILTICKKINRTLNQEQKVVVLMRLFELVRSNMMFTQQRMNIINTVAEVFNIPPSEFSSVELFMRKDDPAVLKSDSILVLSQGDSDCTVCRRMLQGYHDTLIYVLRVASVDLIFIRFRSADQLYINGLPVSQGTVYTFAKGSSLKSQQGLPIYYSDIVSKFQTGLEIHRLSFRAENLTLNFREGKRAIENISFSTREGNLIGILGASGSGKTTLLNLISGILKPSSGKVTVNGIDVHSSDSDLEGVFGYVPQDDLLIEELTVFENLYYAACFCFGDRDDAQIRTIVGQTLSSLGLAEKKDLKVGTPLNKVISGGQRKRLNIALELIREPAVLFLDEPTSGLSSRDSENMMDLLRELTSRGILIFTVIHQPSSDIFKMFDKVLILDQGGYMAYFGNPVDSVIYFKTLDAQVNSDQGECPSCGNVNPETIFNIIETRVVDEFGQYTEQRKVEPQEWALAYVSHVERQNQDDTDEPPHRNLKRPGMLSQFLIYLRRDLSSKMSNRQYLAIALLEAPVLGFILSFLIRYIPDPSSTEYIFAENENIPIYIFMSLIAALFLGLTISAEEIYRDRMILRREHFLNLNRTSYLMSKVAYLMALSAVQMGLFVLIANPILGIRGMNMAYWAALFATSFCANMLGLNISASFNSAITIYIVIPLLIIPMMVLSGAMFPFDKLNRSIGNVDKVPLIAEMMPTRWTYEALIVTQFKDNRYSRVAYDRNGDTYYMLQKTISESEFNKVHRLKVLREALETTLFEYRSNPSYLRDNNNPLLRRTETQFTKLVLLKNEVSDMPRFGVLPFSLAFELTPEGFNPGVADSLSVWLSYAEKHFAAVSNYASDRRDRFYSLNEMKLQDLEKKYYNYKLLEIVTKPYERNKYIIYRDRIVQNADPVYLEPEKKGPLGFRTHFYAPAKYIFGNRVDTFPFNIALTLFSTLLLYFALHLSLLARFVRFIENLKIRK